MISDETTTMDCVLLVQSEMITRLGLSINDRVKFSNGRKVLAQAVKEESLTSITFRKKVSS